VKLHAERPTPPLEYSRDGQRNTLPENQAGKERDTGLMWKAYKKGIGTGTVHAPGRMLSENLMMGTHHVRFEVAGDGNQDMVWAFEALSRGNREQRAAQPKSQAPFPNPTS